MTFSRPLAGSLALLIAAATAAHVPVAPTLNPSSLGTAPPQSQVGGSTQEGLALFHKMQRALGGADRIAAIHDFEQYVRAESWNGNTGQSMGEVKKRTRWIQPNILRVDQVGPGSTYVLYFDGTSGWEIIPGTQKVVAIKGDELAFARSYIRGFRLNVWLADRDARVRITTPSRNVVRLSDGELEHQSDITLDSSSWLPIKTSGISLADPAHPISSDEVITDWETVQGIRVPRRWTVYRGGVRVAAAIEAVATINSGLKLADIAKTPPDLTPELAAR